MSKKKKEAKEREVRTFLGGEMRVDRGEDDAPKIVGHAAVYDSPTLIEGFFGGFEEQIASGAFDGAINGDDDVRALFNHNPDLILGRKSAGTLSLADDDMGLEYTINPPDTTAGRDTLTSIERRDITGSSFGFRVTREEWKERKGKPDLRTILEVELFDVSPVTFPAYPDTDVAKRNHEEFRASLPPEDPQLHPDEMRQEEEEDWKVIPFSRHGDDPTQPVDTPWNGPQERADADVDELKMMSLFEDKNHLEIKSAFKGHHHTADANRVNWNGVRAAMGVLRGARGGFKDISDDELSKGYDHLVKHYNEFEKDPPDNPFRSAAGDLDKMRMRLRLTD